MYGLGYAFALNLLASSLNVITTNPTTESKSVSFIWFSSVIVLNNTTKLGNRYLPEIPKPVIPAWFMRE